MLSSTYQQQSDPRPDAARARPREPAALAVQPPAARLRGDARLAPGRLGRARSDDRRPGRSSITEPPFSTRRTVYGFIDRQNLDGLYRTFDFAVPDATSPRRFVTTVPQQALFLMNSPFLHEQARRLAASTRRSPPGGVRECRPIRPRASAGSTVACSAGRPSPTSWPWPSSSSDASPAADPAVDGLEGARRPARPSRSSRPGNSWPRCCCLTNEFMFVD